MTSRLQFKIAFFASEVTCEATPKDECACTGEERSCASKRANSEEKIDKSKVLCYSCQNILQNVDTLPDFLKSEAAQNLRRQAMQNDIKDFLI